MDSRTGHIYDEEMMAKLDAKHRDKLVPIPADQEDAVRGMNRKQRRTWAALQRRKAARP